MHMKEGTTLKQYILAETRQKELPGDLAILLHDIANCCKEISFNINRGDLVGILGSNESENVQGEVQKKLDVISDEILIENMQWTGHLAGMASEENDDPIEIDPAYPRGKYLLLFDPLDGSSNIDINISVGTIFSVLECPEECNKNPQPKSFLQPGSKQVCAGYALYGPSTMLIITIGHGVQGFTLDPGIGEFVLTHPEMKVPEDTKEFAINASNQRHWEPPMQEYIGDLLAGKEGPRGKDFNMRWVASMVAEIHRILNRGGIFMYPQDKRDPSKPGRLRLMYEANPMSFIIEQAGGMASTGKQRMLDVEPTDLHQRIPVILGSKNEVEKVLEYYQKHS